jgi:hypothetical protein
MDPFESSGIPSMVVHRLLDNRAVGRQGLEEWPEVHGVKGLEVSPT